MKQTDTQTTMRDRILARVRANRPAAVEHPEIPSFGISGDKLTNFTSHVEAFDGKVVACADRAEAVRWLTHNILPGDQCKVLSMIPEYAGNVTPADLPSAADAHELSVCVAEGILGVGETGSVLIDASTFGKPANGLLALHLYLLLERGKITDGIQDAYALMDLASTQYSAFFSGPSATADIEAVHITGAQGPLSLTVLLY